MRKLIEKLVLMLAFVASGNITEAFWNANWSKEIQKDNENCGLLHTSDFIIVSERVVTPQGIAAAEVHVKNGVISSITKRPFGEASKKLTGLHKVIDFGDLAISPGLVDSHVHLNEPGRTSWEGFSTGTRAAAAGGVTTLVDMPLNCIPPTTSKEALDLKRQVTADELWVDVAFWGGLVPENAANVSILEELFEAGAVGLKGFLCESGVEEFPSIEKRHIEAALPVLAKYRRPLVLHSELIPKDKREIVGDPRKYKTYLDSRPPEWEVNAVEMIAELAKSTAIGQKYEGAKLHIVHLATAECIPVLKAARDLGADLTAQACPHYLTFSAEEIPDGQTQYKCAPPIRGRENKERLWEGLLDGNISILASDHSPSLPSLKHLDDGNFLEAWGGVAGLQFDLMASWTGGKTRGVTLPQLSRWWSESPAEFVGLPQKGSIEVGKDADFVVWSPETEVVINQNYTIYHRHKVTPYKGMTLQGKIQHTFVRGQLVYSDGSHSNFPCGKHLLPMFAYTSQVA